MDYSELNDVLSSSSSSDVGAAFAVLGVFFMFILFIVLLIVVFKIISRWVFFKKCGEDGWKSLIPFYNDYVLVKIAGLNWWWILILYAGSILSIMKSSLDFASSNSDASSFGVIVVFISFLNVVASLAALFTRINYCYNISKRFNKNAGYTVLLVLFEPIMLLILGASKNEVYDANVEVSANGIFATKTIKPSVFCADCGTEVKEDYCPKCGKKVR